MERALSPASPVHHGPSAPWAVLALVFVLYFACAKLGMYTVMPEGIAVLWLPNGVVLAALIRLRGAWLLPLGAAVLAAEFSASWPAFSPAEAVLFGLINFGEACLAWRLLERLGFDPGFTTLADAWKFAIAGPFLAAFSASLLGAAVYSVFRGGATPYPEFVRIWWFGDGLGMLIMTPLLLEFVPVGRDGAGRHAPRAEHVVFAMVALAIMLAIGMEPERRLLGIRIDAAFLLLLVLYAAARYSRRVSALVVAAAAATVVVAATRGAPPFGMLPPRDAVIHAQLLIVILGTMGLGLASLLAELRARQRELEMRVAERTKDLRAANEKLARMAAMDPLSGLVNRGRFDEMLATEVERCRRYGIGLALVLADIDEFKRVNDTYGHLAGDEVIRAFARVLGEGVRATDVVARYGGEEFAILMPHTGAESAAGYAERARASLAGLRVDGVEAPVTASFGVAELQGGGDARALVEQADQALYRAKRDGRNRVARAVGGGDVNLAGVV